MPLCSLERKELERGPAQRPGKHRQRSATIVHRRSSHQRRVDRWQACHGQGRAGGSRPAQKNTTIVPTTEASAATIAARIAALVPLRTAIQLMGTSATRKKIAASAADQPATIHNGSVSPTVRMNNSSAAILIAQRAKK